MADNVEPTPPPIPSANSEPSSLDLPPNVAAAIACIPLIGGIVFWLLEKRNSFVRFYAMQSIIFGIACIIIWMACAIIGAIFAHIPLINAILIPFWSLVALLIDLALFIITIIAMWKAFTGIRWDIPYIGPIARKQVGEG